MNRQDYILAKRALMGGSRYVIATTTLERIGGQRIRVIQLRMKNGQYEGKYINDGKWYAISRVEVL